MMVVIEIKKTHLLTFNKNSPETYYFSLYILGSVVSDLVFIRLNEFLLGAF